MFRLFGLLSFCVLFLVPYAKKCSQGTSPASVLQEDAAFHTDFVSGEFIVTFYKFYQRSSRIKFLSMAMHRINVSEWEVLERHNAASHYPSDFDILRVRDASVGLHMLDPLVAHPAIKWVTPQRSVRRVLTYTPADNGTFDFGNFAAEEGDATRRRLLRQVPQSTPITTTLEANVLWKMGITGRGVKVAVFDTGLSKNHPHFRRVKERTNWTNEKSLEDGVSHGTFVAGVIASEKECLGIAPDAELHIFRVFTNTQISYTSWFLDAFNYAIYKKINVLNLSIGGPDFLDRPFVEKILELSANKVIMISAIGNDGPLYGTLNNPGDQSDVIGVGGINFDNKVAKFSSRGMTTWELPTGYGRLKPDIVTFGNQVKGSDVHFGCRSLSGTSVASPIVAGATALIISGALHKMRHVNPSSIKQILIEGATRLPDNNMFEQGHGKLNILESMRLLTAYEPRVSFSPAYLDTTEHYMWPYNSQPLYWGSAPLIVNVTVLNAISVSSHILEMPVWHTYSPAHKDILNVAISYSPIVWPWSGWMAVQLVVAEQGSHYEGYIRGHISLRVQSFLPNGGGGAESTTNSTLLFPINVQIIARPPRHKRILWDQYHNLRYPPGYIPRDNLKVKSDPLDWRSDHIHTNFREMYVHLRNSGYYIDVLSTPFTCFEAADYGTLLLVDPEKEFHREEIVKLARDVRELGLSLIVFADWYNVTVMKKIKFFDENTRQWWMPETGGANVPALNDLLSPFGIAFGDLVAEGHYKWGDHSMYYASGATIAKYPRGGEGILIGADLLDQGAEILNATQPTKKRSKTFEPILGIFDVRHLPAGGQAAHVLSTSSNYEEVVVDPLELKNADLKDVNLIIKRNLLEVREIGLAGNQSAALLQRSATKAPPSRKDANPPPPPLLLPLAMKQMPAKESAPPPAAAVPLLPASSNMKGRIVVFGDSNCLDSAHMEKPCFWLLEALLEVTMNSHVPEVLQKQNKIAEFNERAAAQATTAPALPLRLGNSFISRHSRPIEACLRLHFVQPVVMEAPSAEAITQRSPAGREEALLVSTNALQFQLDVQAGKHLSVELQHKLTGLNHDHVYIVGSVSLLLIVFLLLFIYRTRRSLFRLRLPCARGGAHPYTHT